MGLATGTAGSYVRRVARRRAVCAVFTKFCQFLPFRPRLRKIYEYLNHLGLLYSVGKWRDISHVPVYQLNLDVKLLVKSLQTTYTSRLALNCTFQSVYKYILDTTQTYHLATRHHVALNSPLLECLLFQWSSQPV